MFICSDDELFWTEKKENFIKICFPFTPEFDKDLNQVNFIYKKICDKISIYNYKIFSLNNENGKWITTLTTDFNPNGLVQILVPLEQKIDADYISQLFIKKNCKFTEIYHSFHSIKISDLQKEIKDSYIITQSFITNNKKLSLYTKEIGLHNIAIYSVDIYGINVDKIDFELN